MNICRASYAQNSNSTIMENENVLMVVSSFEDSPKTHANECQLVKSKFSTYKKEFYAF